MTMASSSSISRPRNLLTIFQAHFHVRRGNEITYQHGHELDLSGVEWKALPSGSHALHRDLIWFHTPGQREETVGEEGERYHRVGVAAFVTRKLGGQGDDDEDGEDEDDQRGARMIAVGIIALASSSTPSAHLAACLPHIDALESLAAQSASRPRDHKILDAFLDAHRFNPSASEYDLRSALESVETLRIPAPLARRAISGADPLLDLPAVVNALGLLLPQLLRKLLVRGTRLVIFCPLGAQTRTAAAIAWALAEILEASLHVDDDESYQDGEGGEEENNEAAQRLRHRRRLRIPQIRGIIGLQDLALLQEEQRRAPLPQGWISWTTDKLLLEKPDLYDCLLDLSPLFPAAQQHQAAAAASTSAAGGSSSSSLFSSPARDSSPNLYRVEHLADASKKGRTAAKLKRVPWLPRDFALARSNEHRSVRLASRPRSLARRGSRSSVRFTPSDDGGVERARIRQEASEALKGPQSSFGQQLTARDGSSRSPVALLAHLLAFLRYWVSSLSFIPQQWRINLRESYGYVPLSIRPDGGVQAGLMLLPDSDESESEGSEGSGSESGESGDEEQGEDGEEGEQADGGASSSSSPRSRRTSRLSNTTTGTGSSRRLRVATASTTSGGIALTDDGAQDDFFTNPSVSPRLTAVDDDDHIDPLLAACGVHSPAASRSGGGGGAGGPSGSVRRSGSRSRQASAAGSVARDVLVGTDDAGAGAEGGQTGGSSSTAASPSSQKHLTPPAAAAAAKSASSSSSVGGQLVPPSPTPNSRRRKRTTSQDVHRDTRLARAIFTIWAEWLRDLILDLEALAVTPAAGGYEDDRAAADKLIDADENRDDDRAELLPSSASSSSTLKQDSSSVAVALPPLTSRQLSALGLNSRNEEDRLLVVDMTEGRREVVAGGLWRFWGNWF